MKIILSLMMLTILACGASRKAPEASPVKGKQIAFDREKGNCLACHRIEDGEFPGDIGPELKSLSSRFKDKDELRNQIWDATQFNPQTSMPPFGRNKILTSTEIDLIVDYLWGIK